MGETEKNYELANFRCDVKKFLLLFKSSMNISRGVSLTMRGVWQQYILRVCRLRRDTDCKRCSVKNIQRRGLEG
jgi:hypothetical protein